jgi:apolipoprotein N-acyltransferase
LVGSHGLSALAVFFLTGLLWMARRRRPNWAWIAVFSGLAVYTWVWMDHPEKEGTIRIGVVQTDVDERARFYDGDGGEGMREALEFSRQALDQGAGLLLWPESVFVWEYSPDLETDPVRADFFRRMEELSRRAPMFIVANRYEEEKAYNTAQLLRDGRVLGMYRKTHLVPFGEYLPLRGLAERLGLIRVARSISDFSPGREPGVFQEPLPVGMSICFEAVYPHLVREQVRLGARLLVTLTNDSWYGSGGAPEQHFRLALMRSVELHRPLARSALTGVSGFADTHGRILDRLPLGSKGFLIRDIQPSGRRTIYGMTGDLLSALFALASILMGLRKLALWTRSRRMRKDAKAHSIH